MDIRKQKTQQAIREAFLQLRNEKNVEQITVTELAKAARISKATFYLHYRDIYDLSEQLQRNAIRGVLITIDHPTDVLENLADFMQKLKTALDSEAMVTAAPLFYGSQAPLLPILLAKELKEAIFQLHPEYRNDEAINIRLSYHIYGGYYSFMENRVRFDDAMVLKVIQEIHTQVS